MEVVTLISVIASTDADFSKYFHPGEFYADSESPAALLHANDVANPIASKIDPCPRWTNDECAGLCFATPNCAFWWRGEPDRNPKCGDPLWQQTENWYTNSMFIVTQKYHVTVSSILKPRSMSL